VAGLASGIPLIVIVYRIPALDPAAPIRSPGCE
jgi:hypothetical protein